MMKQSIRLEQFLALRAQRQQIHPDLSAVLMVIAATGAKLARVISRRGLPESIPEAGSIETDSPHEQSLPMFSHGLFVEALTGLPLSLVTSEMDNDIIEIDPDARLAVALDPLDGASNTDINAAIGTVFSVLEATPATLHERNLGDMLCAAGFLFYGPQTRLVLSCGDGTYSFVLDPEDGCFYQAGDAISIPNGRYEFAIKFSNYRFWDESVRYFIDDCLAGASGPMGEDFNVRWTASLVAAAFRIMMRGGVFLYPGDSRPGYESGRLQLLHEALPLAFLIEQAGGLASDGSERILEMKLAALQSRVPLIFGSSDRVKEVIDYMTGDAVENTRFPLFENRSLFRN